MRTDSFRQTGSDTSHPLSAIRDVSNDPDDDNGWNRARRFKASGMRLFSDRQAERQKF